MILALPQQGHPVLPVRVIDIGATGQTGAPWDRGDTARLAARLAGANPAVVVSGSWIERVGSETA